MFWSYLCFIVLYLLIITLVVILINRITLGICKSNSCLTGKTVLITGGNAGIGFHTALILAGRGARVIIADKDDAAASVERIAAYTNNKNVVYKYIDMGSFTAIRKFAKEINAEEERLDILINNAGSTAFGDKISEDNLPLGTQVNYLGAFLLTHLLIDLMKKSAPSRILFMSSFFAFVNNISAENLDKIPATKPELLKEMYTYSNSKLMNIIAANIFAEKLRDYGITSNSIHPGLVNTQIFRCLYPGWVLTHSFFQNTILRLIGKIPWEGAQTTVRCATSKSLEHVTGKFFADCRTFWQPWKSRDRDFCTKLWRRSEDLVKLGEAEKLL